MKRDLTVQEVVREARKIDGFSWWTISYLVNGPDVRAKPLWKIEGAGQMCVMGRTLRSCLAKLKKEVGR